MYTSLDFTVAILAAHGELAATIDATIEAEDRYNTILKAEGVEAADEAMAAEVSRLQRKAEALRRLIPTLEAALKQTEEVEGLS